MAFSDFASLEPELRYSSKAAYQKYLDAYVEHTLEARVLIVATGSQHEPHVPGVEGYTGQVLHSSGYRGRDEFAGKRVLVVGIGESASDIAAAARKMVVLARTPFEYDVHSRTGHVDFPVLLLAGYSNRPEDLAPAATAPAPAEPEALPDAGVAPDAAGGDGAVQSTEAGATTRPSL